MSSDSVTSPPDTKPTITSDPATTPPDTKPTNTSNPVTTPTDSKPTITSDLAAIHISTTPITMSDTVTTPSHQASFASLPREIRDEIYRLVIPHSCSIKIIFVDTPTRPSGGYSILLPQASTYTYANEAGAMLFKRNIICVKDKQLQMMLGEDGINYVYHGFANYVWALSKGRFDVKPWLRIIRIELSMEDEMGELAGGIGLLLKCSALRKVTVVLHGGRSLLKRAIRTIFDAFKALAEKLGGRLIFTLIRRIFNDDGEREPYEELIGDLEKLETMAARDEDSDSEDEY